jgi:4'-phosphopantetheinyl transferase
MIPSSPEPGTVTVWWCSVHEVVPRLKTVRRLLDETEIRRADRFSVGNAMNRFVTARGMLRLVVGRSLDTDPSRLRIREGPRGKPSLASPATRSTPHFNLSHSGDAVVVALADVELGIDVEALRPVARAERLAARFFSDGERRQLAGREVGDRDAAFLTIWTAKEAYLKAIGSGVAMPLSQIEIDLSGPSFSRIVSDPHEAGRWTLLQTRLPIGAVCSVAIRGAGWRLDVREFDWGQIESSNHPEEHDVG